MKDAECAETNAISIFRFLLFTLSLKFIESWGDLSTKMTIIWKINIGKLIYLSIQHILHLSCKFYHFRKKYILIHAKRKKFFCYAVDTNLFRLGSTNPGYWNARTLHFSSSFQFFFVKHSNLHERCRMCWIERKIKLPIFIFLVMIIFWYFFDVITPIFECLWEKIHFNPTVRFLWSSTTMDDIVKKKVRVYLNWGLWSFWSNWLSQNFHSENLVSLPTCISFDFH